MINRRKITFEEYAATAELSAFCTENGVGEYHAMIHVAPKGQPFHGQLQRLSMAWGLLMAMPEMQGVKPVFKRFFLSDATNQAPLIHDEDGCTISLIQQSPLDGSKVALWVYGIKGAEIDYNVDDLHTTVVRHNGYEHLWTMGMMHPYSDSFDQTLFLLCGYEKMLRDGYNANVADNCIRTWFFVRDVDTNYKGLVDARRENFLEQGMTPETHYVASTGIGGSPANTNALVQLGAYAMTGLKEGQQQYLYALDHLNRTIEYGVTFERGTLVRYGDRAHSYISGTASIDNKGQVVHVGDVERQTYRMWENVEALLREADMTFDDVMQVIVYLRDIADYSVVERLFRQKFPDMPYVITLAPVCRPQWLIEMECIAVSAKGDARYLAF